MDRIHRCLRMRRRKSNRFSLPARSPPLKRMRSSSNSPQPAQAVKSEIERYILGPGQATSYKIGMIAIQKLRDEAKAALGGKFDYRKFHDAVLDGGALPIPVQDAKVHRWIEREKRA